MAPVTNRNGGTTIDLEDDLKFDDGELLPAAFAGARIGGGFSLGLEYYSLNRDSTATLARDIIVDDVVYPINASVTAGFDTDIYRATVGWAFVRKENFEVGAAIGLHATRFLFSIEGRGTVTGETTIKLQNRQQDFLAPLPTVGLFSTFEVAPRLTLGGRADYFSLSVGKYDGRLVNAQASLAYRLTRNFGAGIMYRHVDYRVDVEKFDYVGRVAYSFDGPAVFVEAGF